MTKRSLCIRPWLPAIGLFAWLGCWHEASHPGSKETPPGTTPKTYRDEIWPLTFVPDKSAEKLLAGLNAIFGTEANKTPITLAGNRLLLNVEPSTLPRVKRLLALIDYPWPQVQLNLWAIQVSGSAHEVANRVRIVSEKVDATRGAMNWIQELLHREAAEIASELEQRRAQEGPARQALQAVRKARLALESAQQELMIAETAWRGAARTEAQARREMEAAYRLAYNYGVEGREREEAVAAHKLKEALWKTADRNLKEGVLSLQSAQRQWSVAESDLVVAENQSKLEMLKLQGLLLGDLERAGFDLNPKRPISLTEALIFLALADDRESLTKSAVPHFAEMLWKSAQLSNSPTGQFLWNRLKQHKSAQDLFPNLRAAYANATIPQARTGIQNFVSAWLQYRDHGREDEMAAERLREASAAIDRMLKGAIDAYAADIESLLLAPLRVELQQVSGGRGVSLMGHVHTVVTSGLQAKVQPLMESFVETGIPKPLDLNTTLDLVNKLKSGFPNLSETHLNVLAGLLSEPEKAFTKVAPGIDLTVRPTVLPDGGSARLQIKLSVGVTTTPVDPNRTDIRKQIPADAIIKDAIETDAAVSAFDLFDLSSFSIQTTHPRSPFSVPLLGRIPAIGRVFQFPRSNRSVQHESLILVNPIILPRAMDLARFYTLGGGAR